MTIRKRMVLPLALALGAVGIMVVASVASATHPRPKGATPLRVSLVPAFAQCTAPNRTHGPPLAFPSCNPPVQSSTAVTVGSPDANGAAANTGGQREARSARWCPGSARRLRRDHHVEHHGRALQGRYDRMRSRLTRLDGADYTGGMQGNATIRITDHFNAVAAGGGTDPATVVDIPYPIAAACAATASTAIGATCSANTSANAAVPGAVKDGKRANVEVGQITITDGGPDGVVGTTPNTLFAVQGIFIP